MSNTVITNYTDLNGPSSKSDKSVVVIVNKDGSLSVDQNLLGTLMGTDGSQAANISVVRVGHEGKPDDATDSDTDDENVPHVTLSVDSYFNEPNSIIKYDSGAEMLQSLRIETRENSLLGFQNDHCYTPLTASDLSIPSNQDKFKGYDEPIIKITQNPPPKPVPSSKKITILEQKIIPKGKKILLKTNEQPVVLQGSDVLNKNLLKSKQRHEKNEETSSISSSGDSIPDRDSDSDYRDSKDRSGSIKSKRSKVKPRILKTIQQSKPTKLEPKVVSRIKSSRSFLKKEVKEKLLHKNEVLDEKIDIESLLPSTEIPVQSNDKKNVNKQILKSAKKDKKTPAHVTALLSDMSTLFSTPDVIRRVSTDNKGIGKEIPTKRTLDLDTSIDKSKTTSQKSQVLKQKPVNRISKNFDSIPHLDDVSLAQILQDTTGISSVSLAKGQPTIATAPHLNSPGLVGPLSPTLDLLGGIQPDEEGLTEDLLMHVAQLVESSENLQEVIDKQVLGKVDTTPKTTPILSPFQHTPQQNIYPQTPKQVQKTVVKSNPIEIVRRDGRIITLPPIEAPATRASKRKIQLEPTSIPELPAEIVEVIPPPIISPPETPILHVSKQYINKKLISNIKKQDPTLTQAPAFEKACAESQESWNSEDDPNRLWCICRQPHNNRFMICCDGCEDWFHGKCVNITKAMGQEMEGQGIEWRCPNCIKKAKPPPAKFNKSSQRKSHELTSPPETPQELATKVTLPHKSSGCIVCKKPARSSSIYCSEACILKHAQDSLSSPTSPSSLESPGVKLPDVNKSKNESRIIVYERKSGRLLAGPNAPTAENLKQWLQKNPTFEVVRPGTLNTIKPNMSKKSFGDSKKIQTTLNFQKIPKKPGQGPFKPVPGESPKTPQPGPSTSKVTLTPKEVAKSPLPKTPVTPKSLPSSIFDTPTTSKALTPKTMTEPRKLARATSSRSQSAADKIAASVSPAMTRRKDSQDKRRIGANSTEPIRDNVRKALAEQMIIRMKETSGSKFTEDDIYDFANVTETELHELFKDVGMKYKAKYRSLMFNIKDRKNLSLWQKICDQTITPKQLVRLSPEELASQELAQWRDQEAKHQLELIKKSELDLLAASKTYVLKTHKGEEVMQTKESISTELDPNVPVEDLVTALNDSTAPDQSSDTEDPPSSPNKIDRYERRRSSSRRKEKEESNSKKSRRDSKKETDSRKSRSSRRSEVKDREERSYRRRSSRNRSSSKDRSMKDSSKEKADVSERRYSSRSSTKAKKRSKSREGSGSKNEAREKSRSRGSSRRRSRSRRRTSSRSRSTRSDDKAKIRSKSQDYGKNKQESTDSDSLERPKSAMQKEVHPEYDPHEPMITSAFSEEDLRKSRDDIYGDSYKEEEYGSADYDAMKFSLDTSVTLPTISTKKDKASEGESDQEPSSTVDNSAAIVWNGCINMVDVARFYVAAHEVSGSASDLEEELSSELDIVGRINPETVWDYICKTKRASNKDIIILRLHAANDEEKMQYIALYSYLSTRNRLGVVKVSNTASIKDFYIFPLAANTPLPPTLLPLDGPGLGDAKNHLLIAIVVRQKNKRLPPQIPIEIVPAKEPRKSRKRSYTPPIVGSKSGETPPQSPKRRSLRVPYSSPPLSTSIKDKIAASLASAEDEEPYSPGSSSSSNSNPAPAIAPPPADALRSKMDELNRQIEEQKQQIRKLAQAEDEAYSPSGPLSPAESSTPVNPLADISLPSDLQEILANIKRREASTTQLRPRLP